MDHKFQQSNNNLYKEKAEYYNKSIKLMFKSIVKKTPREILIEVLVEEKIIKRAWEEDGVKYNLK